jgi:hypothetical protein
MTQGYSRRLSLSNELDMRRLKFRAPAREGGNETVSFTYVSSRSHGAM